MINKLKNPFDPSFGTPPQIILPNYQSDFESLVKKGYIKKTEDRQDFQGGARAAVGQCDQDVIY